VTPRERAPRGAVLTRLRPRAPTRAREARARHPRERRVGAPAAPAGRELDAAAVGEVIDRHRARLRQCYTTALRREGVVREASLRMTLDIAPSGDVSAVDVASDGPADLPRCLRRTAILWSFPASTHGGHVPLPLHFSPVEPR